MFLQEINNRIIKSLFNRFGNFKVEGIIGKVWVEGSLNTLNDGEGYGWVILPLLFSAHYDEIYSLKDFSSWVVSLTPLKILHLGFTDIAF